MHTSHLRPNMHTCVGEGVFPVCVCGDLNDVPFLPTAPILLTQSLLRTLFILLTSLSQETPICLPLLGLQVDPHRLTFTWVLQVWTLVLTHSQEAIYPLSHLSGNHHFLLPARPEAIVLSAPDLQPAVSHGHTSLCSGFYVGIGHGLAPLGLGGLCYKFSCPINIGRPFHTFVCGGVNILNIDSSIYSPIMPKRTMSVHWG